ncbi:hypothetical protein ACQ4XT_06410 [Halobacillus faecis]
MSNNNEYLKAVAKMMKKWINNKYPENRKVRVNGNRGPHSRFSNEDLVDIALEIKKELRGEKVNPSVLEQATDGIIGRQIWRRRIPGEIERINTPVVNGRELGVRDNDEVNHVNIDVIVERYSNNPRELVNHLYHIEESRIILYDMVKKLKKDNEDLENLKEQNDRLASDNETLKEELAHYIYLSNNLYVSSFFPDLRREVGLDRNAIDMELNLEKSTTTNLHTLFPPAKEIAIRKEQIEKPETSNTRKAGEQLIDDIKNEFGDLFND